jgi:hypothetical protein
MSRKERRAMNTAAKLKALLGSEAFDQVSEQLILFILDNGEIFGCLLSHLVDSHYHPNGRNWYCVAVGLVAIGGPKALTSKKPLQKGGEAGPRRLDRILCL